MSKAVTMRAGETTFLVETDESVEVPAHLHVVVSTELRAGVPDGMQPVVDLEKVQREFAEVRELIVVCCNGLHEAITRIPRPESVGVEFGIKLAGEAGIPMLTKASGEANFKVIITWKPEKAG